MVCPGEKERSVLPFASCANTARRVGGELAMVTSTAFSPLRWAGVMVTGRESPPVRECDLCGHQGVEGGGELVARRAVGQDDAAADGIAYRLERKIVSEVL